MHGREPPHDFWGDPTNVPWYDEQEFYRSRDGVTWEVLLRGAYAGSHPISFIAFGRGARPAACR
jgi:hypothetical protein